MPTLLGISSMGMCKSFNCTEELHFLESRKSRKHHPELIITISVFNSLKKENVNKVNISS